MCYCIDCFTNYFITSKLDSCVISVRFLKLNDNPNSYADFIAAISQNIILKNQIVPKSQINKSD